MAMGVSENLPLPRVSDRGLRLLSELVLEYSGISVGADKHQLVANRLRRRVRELHLNSVDAYGDYVRADATGAELETLVDLITTNHTAFFREPEHFSVFFDRLIPTLRADMPSGYPVRVWSAAAASGEEPYTLALLAAEAQRQDPLMRVNIQASDISRRMLDVAARGVYSMESISVIPKEMLHRYFERGVAAQDGNCRLRREVRASVNFQRINLLDTHYPVSDLQHVIFCRNVMIYFEVETRRKVVERLLSHLAPGGYLIVGYSESISGLLPGLNSVSHGIYRRS